jgi:hypothetical protein
VNYEGKPEPGTQSHAQLGFKLTEEAVRFVRQLDILDRD